MAGSCEHGSEPSRNWSYVVGTQILPAYEGVSIGFRTDCLERGLQMVQPALCLYVQLYRYFVSQSSEFCLHNPLCCFSTSVYFYCCLFRYRVSPETFGYTLIRVCVTFLKAGILAA
jgi:hypothetical protein